MLPMNENPEDPPEHPREDHLENKMFRLTPEAIRAFDILKAEQGARSGPRLMAEAIDLLLVKYGKQPVGRPVRGSGPAPDRGTEKPAPG